MIQPQEGVCLALPYLGGGFSQGWASGPWARLLPEADMYFLSPSPPSTSSREPSLTSLSPQYHLYFYSPQLCLFISRLRYLLQIQTLGSRLIPESLGQGSSTFLCTTDILGWVILCYGGTVQRIVGDIAASLVSTHKTPVTFPPPN